ncbi:MAG: hypothetical protein OEW09_08865 [Anaerolineae bacterium]|nr:hypothetical protein [Anaerolineae bacterium]
MGTIYLIWKRRAGNICLGIFLVLTTIMLIVTLNTPVDTIALQEGDSGRQGHAPLHLPLLTAAQHPRRALTRSTCSGGGDSDWLIVSQRYNIVVELPSGPASSPEQPGQPESPGGWP